MRSSTARQSGDSFSRSLWQRGALVLAVGLLLSACADGSYQWVSPEIRAHAPLPPGRQVGPAYTVNGQTYVPREQPGYDAVGIASWYGRDYQGRRTASGDVFDMNAHTAAHPTLPFGTPVLVTNLRNGRQVLVVINDRGPFRKGRIIDVTQHAAHDLGFLVQGTARVRVQHAPPRLARR